MRIGYVNYLNTLPLVQGLEVARGLTLVPAVPSALAGMLERREVDVALASLVDFARSPAPLTLLPSGGIGCDGPTLTVRLFSSMPPGEIQTLHADADSHTSVILAQLILKERFNASPRIVTFDARERVVRRGASESAGASPISSPGESAEWPPALLLIGDKVVTDSPPAVRYPHQLDLGEAWKSLTGLPFVYATWMCRAEDEARPEVRSLASLLERQRLRNTMRTGWLVDLAASERRWPRDLAHRYVTEYLRYEIGPRQREAVARFLSMAAAHGLLPAATPRWLEPSTVTSEGR